MDESSPTRQVPEQKQQGVSGGQEGNTPPGHTHTPLGHGCWGKEEAECMGDVIEGELIKWKRKCKEYGVVCLVIT